MAVAANGNKSEPTRTTNPNLTQHKQSNARWAKPMPRAHINFIPAQSWLEYNWSDKDPELEFVLHAIEESGWTLERIERECEAHGHRVSRYTLLAWFYKGVKRPQNATMNTVMAVIGWHRPWQRLD